MASDIVGGSGNDIQVDVGGGNTVSMQTVQHIYNEITGRTERLSKSYSDGHMTSFEDLKQLDIKIKQLYEQYNIVSNNTSVTLFHVDDQKQVFSSFERFELFDRTTLSPVENISIEYNFLIILPQARKPQSYKIEINIHSRAAIQQRAEEEQGFTRRFLLDLVADKTANFEIEYIDYTVARTFQGAIDNWFKGLKQTKQNKAIGWLKKHTEHFSFTFRFISTAVFFLVCANWYLSKFAEPDAGIELLFIAASATFGGLFFINAATGKLGSVCENAVNRLRPNSYIKLTRGDEITIERMLGSCRKNRLIATVSVVLTIVLNVFSSWIAIAIGIR